jgi:chaperonin GroEL
VIARDLGGRIAAAELSDLGSARQVRIAADQTVISAGGGDPASVAARRQQIARQHEAAPPNIERDKYQERLAKLSGGTAVILAGGATPVEQKRRVQLIEDAINAARAAIEDGIVAGGGTALLQVAPDLAELAERLSGSAREGASLVQSALAQPLACIAANCGLDAGEIVARVARSPRGIGFDARTAALVDLVEAGVIDPVRVSTTALRNAASVAGLILTTQTLIATKPEGHDPTAGPALGGGAERLGLT